MSFARAHPASIDIEIQAFSVIVDDRTKTVADQDERDRGLECLYARESFLIQQDTSEFRTSGGGSTPSSACRQRDDGPAADPSVYHRVDQGGQLVERTHIGYRGQVGRLQVAGEALPDA